MMGPMLMLRKEYMSQPTYTILSCSKDAWKKDIFCCFSHGQMAAEISSKFSLQPIRMR